VLSIGPSRLSQKQPARPLAPRIRHSLRVQAAQTLQRLNDQRQAIITLLAW
jgi:hypothetical protein